MDSGELVIHVVQYELCLKWHPVQFLNERNGVNNKIKNDTSKRRLFNFFLVPVEF